MARRQSDRPKPATTRPATVRAWLAKLRSEKRARTTLAGQPKARRVHRHSLALIAGVVVALLFLAALMAEFVAPYDPDAVDPNRAHRPPARIHWSQQGRLTQPFVYGTAAQRNPQTQALEFAEDTGRVYPLYMFCYFDRPYRLWGWISGELHLFGLGTTEEMVMLWGADAQGRDLFARVIHGARVSLSIGLLAAALSLVLGGLLGSLAGALGGAMDAAVRFAIRFLRSLPAIPLWMALGAALPAHWPDLWVYGAVAVLLTLVGWVGVARTVRARLVALRGEDFILAARLDGCSTFQIIVRHVAPALRSHLVAAFALTIPPMILGETALSFLGLGLRQGTPGWGVLLQDVQDIRVVAQAPWLLIPGSAVALAVLALSLLGEGLHRAVEARVPHTGTVSRDG